MAEEVGIVMTLYDRVSPTLKSIAGSNKAFDKSLDELEASLKAYDKAQTELVGRSANLKKAIAETDVKVREAQKSYRKLKDETSKGALDDAIDEQARLRRELSDTETAIKENSAAYQDLYKQARNAASAISKVDNRAGAGGGADGSGASMLAALGKAGLGQMAGRCRPGGGQHPDRLGLRGYGRGRALLRPVRGHFRRGHRQHHPRHWHRGGRGHRRGPGPADWRHTGV